MALIDVSDLLHDPDFVDPISLVTRTPTVNSFGENVIQEVTLNSYGSVQSISGKALQRLPEALRSANVYSFFFQGTIVASSAGLYPSILVFKGDRYQVQQVFDWTNFGAGYSEGICVMEMPS